MTRLRCELHTHLVRDPLTVGITFGRIYARPYAHKHNPIRLAVSLCTTNKRRLQWAECFVGQGKRRQATL